MRLYSFLALVGVVFVGGCSKPEAEAPVASAPQSAGGGGSIVTPDVGGITPVTTPSLDAAAGGGVSSAMMKKAKGIASGGVGSVNNAERQGYGAGGE